MNVELIPGYDFLARAEAGKLVVDQPDLLADGYVVSGINGETQFHSVVPQIQTLRLQRVLNLQDIQIKNKPQED
jgi:hypothetical protein